MCRVTNLKYLATIIYYLSNSSHISETLFQEEENSQHDQQDHTLNRCCQHVFNRHFSKESCPNLDKFISCVVSDEHEQ